MYGKLILGTKYNKIKFTVMKRLLLSVILATSLAFTSCQFDDSDIWDKFGEMEESIRDHEQRISALEELCKQMNTNIEALQTLVSALEKRDYITNISPIREDGVIIGYTISFAYNDTITIYHGQDGKDGINGKDGYTPQIGVMKDTDGIYYWTLDGEWLLDGKGNKIKAVGTDGKDGQDGTNGSNGSDGKDGVDGVNGKDGVTPQLKIENDYWYVSYDNGVTWIQLGKATGEDGKDGQDGNDGADGSDGADGADGADGDSIFKSVTQDDEYVYFNLSDGTMITLPKHDKENIQFEDLQVKAICCKNWDTNKDGELSYAEAAAVETFGTIFRENTNIIAFTEFKYFTGITEIPANAFNGCKSLWKISLPENIKTIGEGTFYKCSSLSKVNLPNGVTTIGNNAFLECTALSDIKFSESLQLIGDYAFYNCQSLSNIIIPNGVHTIGGNAFYACGDNINVYIPNSVKSMDWALNYCGGTLTIDCDIITTNMLKGANFSRVIIGDNVTIIEKDAFFNHSGLNYIHIGKKVESIQDTFYGCNITDVDVSDLSKWYEIDHNYGLAVLVNNHTADLSLNGAPILLEGDIVIPDGVTKIGDYAFYGNSKITSIAIPNSVISIGELTFYECKNIKNISIPDSVISIKKQAFLYCSGLESITIGSGCVYIDQAFSYGVDNLKTIYCKPSFPPAIYYYYLKSTGGLTKTFPSNATIYVPRASLNYNMQYSSYESNTVATTNWSQHISQIRPYDF